METGKTNQNTDKYEQNLLNSIDNIASSLKYYINRTKDLENQLNVLNTMYEARVEKSVLIHQNESKLIQRIEHKIKELDKKIASEENEKVILWLHKQRNVLQELLEEKGE